MLIEPAAIAVMSLHELTSLRDLSNNTFIRATRYEVRVLAGREMIAGVINKKGELRYMQLLVSRREAQAVLGHLATVDAKGITKRHQDPGAKRWVVRHDRAQTGYGGMSFRIMPRQETDAENADRMDLVALIGGVPYRVMRQGKKAAHN